MILDADFGPMDDPLEVACVLEERAAIVTQGLFLGLASAVVVGGPGGVRELLSEGNR